MTIVIDHDKDVESWPHELDKPISNNETDLIFSQRIASKG